MTRRHALCSVAMLGAIAVSVLPPAGCVGPGTTGGAPGRPESQATRAVFAQLSAPELPEGLAEFLRTDPGWRAARVFSPTDVASDYDREWFFKTGYRSLQMEDLDNDGQSEIAAVVLVKNGLRLLILRPAFAGWKPAYDDVVQSEQAMIRVEALGGAAGSKCILIASGQRGFRESVCWDGGKFVKITL